MSDDYISEDEFWDDWVVLKQPSGDLFDFEDVKDQPLNHVWTIIDSGSDENDNWYASPGFHIVNKLGYVMTEKAWEDETRDAIYYLDDGDGMYSVFVYRYCDAENIELDGLLLVAGDCDEQLHVEAIGECCDSNRQFIPEQVGVPALYGAGHATSDRSMADSEKFHKFVGLRTATDDEAKTLPLWGRINELVWKFREIEGGSC